MTRRQDHMLPLLQEIRACNVCAEFLPHEPRPLIAASSLSRIVIIGQAPGRAAHDSGVPWNDPSGVRLRAWLGVTDEEFYDPKRIALVPMGFCYPGRRRGADAGPRPECAPLWHDAVLMRLKRTALTVLIGRYPLPRYLPEFRGDLTAAVASWKKLLPDRIVLPHPSPRNQRWPARNKWFERKVIPAVQRRVREVLEGG